MGFRLTVSVFVIASTFLGLATSVNAATKKVVSIVCVNSATDQLFARQGKKCKAGETQLNPSNFALLVPSAQGIEGPQGPQGIQGDQGIQGPQGDPGILGLELVSNVHTNVSLNDGFGAGYSAVCPAGKKVTGGGCSSNFTGYSVGQSQPSNVSGGQASAWTCFMQNTSGSNQTNKTVTVWVFCAYPN